MLVRRSVEAVLEATSEGTVTGESKFRDGLVSSFTMILLAEIADKTFFIAAIMAMRYNKLIVFLGAWSALAVMTALSVAMGFLVTFIPQYITHIVAGLLFLLFAFQMFYEAYKMRGQRDAAQKEMEEVGRELRGDDEELRVRFRKDSKSEGAHGTADIVVEIMPTEAEQARSRTAEAVTSGEPSRPVSRASAVSEIVERTTSPDRKSNESVVEEQEEGKVGCTTKTERVLSVFCNAIFIKAFVLTFVAEWGDRSQLSTVGLAVSTNPFSVFIGGSAGHFICTMGAIIFGALVAKKISLSVLNFCGAVIFLGFAGYSFYLAYTGEND